MRTGWGALRAAAPMNPTSRILFAFLLVFLGMGSALGQNLKVPSDFIGIWQGTSGSNNGKTWRITIGILEGSGKNAISFLERREDDVSCTYTLVLDSPKKQDKGMSEKILQTKTKMIKEDCRSGELKFEVITPDRMIVDAKWFDSNPDDWSFVMERLDDGSLGKALGKC